MCDIITKLWNIGLHNIQYCSLTVTCNYIFSAYHNERYREEREDEGEGQKEESRGKERDE